MRRLVIDIRPGEYAVARLEPGDAVAPHLLAGDAGDAGDGQPGPLVSVTRTGTETSVVCPVALAPESATVERGWRLLTVRGPLAFTLTGIIAALASELAAAGVSLFSLSTFDTDHVLVRAADLQRAAAALRAAGHELHGE